MVHFRHAPPGLKFRFGTASGVPPRVRGARRRHSPTICPAAPAGVPPGTWDDFPATQGPGSPGPEPDGQSPKARHRATPHPQGPGHCATSPVDAGQPDQTELQFLPDTLVTTGFPDPQTELLAEDAARESRRPQRVMEESQSGTPGPDQNAGNLRKQSGTQGTENCRVRAEPEARVLHAQSQPERQDCLADRNLAGARVLTPARSKAPEISQPGNRSCSGWGPDTTFIHILPGPFRRYPCSAPENRTRHPAPERRTDQPAAAEGPNEKTGQPIPI